MIATLMNDKEICSVTLPKKIDGQYWLAGIISIEGKNEKWVLKSNKNITIVDQDGNPMNSVVLEALNIYQLMKYQHEDENFIVYIEPVTDDRQMYQKLLIPKNVNITIGRNNNNSILVNNPFISGNHARLTFKENQFEVIDENSTNGTFVNGKRIERKDLKIGDVIYIMGFKMIIGKNFLSYNNPDHQVVIHSQDLSPFVLEDKKIVEDEEEEELVPIEYFYRSPRFKRDIKTFELTIDSPPQEENREELPLIFVLGPSITMGLASFSTILFSISSAVGSGNIKAAMPSIITSSSMLLGTLMWPIVSKRFQQKRSMQKEALRKQKYLAYLENIKKEIEQETKRQKEILLENHITIEECLKRIEIRDRKLWERGMGQNDFLSLKIGMGDIPLDAKLTFPKKQFKVELDSLEEELHKFENEPKQVCNVPITVSLYDNYILGVTGNRKEELFFAKGLIMQIAALYSYDEIKMVFLYDEEEQDVFHFVKWLPHAWNKDKTFRYIATNSTELKDLSSVMELEISNRKKIQKNELADVQPYYVLFALSRKLFLRAEMMKQLCRLKYNINMSIVTFFDELKNLPKECSKIIELHEDKSKIYDKNDISGKYALFQPDIFIEQDMTPYSKKLSNIQLDLLNGMYKLPKMITFLELFGVGKIEYLNAFARWKENDPTKTLETPIGVNTLGDIFQLDLHEEFHGPHGLVAGMTGSGKSEFIMTYILSMAVNYHPNEVAFILIDYKGGGMAKTFEKLPHTAGIITNLDGIEIKRSLISIQSELKRREQIFISVSKKMEISNLDIYKYQKLYRDGLVEEPLQHLFIISDEFAELKSQQPEFMGQLISIARIGRSLGVHLILATQKPNGVVDDQIWSNSRFRICFKVQEKSDSQDMLKRIEAAELKDTGRFYLQVGYNELFELGQSAWSGALYEPSDKVVKEKDESVQIIDRVGRVIKEAKLNYKKNITMNSCKQIDGIVNYLKEIAEEEHIKIKPLWLPPIPEKIYIDDLLKQNRIKDSYGIMPIIGKYDDPEGQRQDILRINISEAGNIILYGATNSGKTMFLQAMIYSILKLYTPQDVNLYILDFESETLNAFEQAPHVGDVILSSEEEKVINLIKMLLGKLKTRRELFRNFGGSIASYNKTATEKEPEIIVIIHNFSLFTELYEQEEESIQYLSREAAKYGIYLILTTNNRMGIRYRLLQNFKQQITLQMNDKTDYDTIFGKTYGMIPSKYKGRGLIKLDKLYEFQTASIIDEEEYPYIKEFCENLKNETVYQAKKTPILPRKVDKKFLSKYRKENTMNLPIGVETSSLQVHYYPFENHYINMVLSMDKDYLCFLKPLLCLFPKNIEMTVLDIHKVFLENIEWEYACKIDAISSIIDALYKEAVYRHNLHKDQEDNGLAKESFSKKVIVIDSLKDLKEKLDDERNQKLALVLEKGTLEEDMMVILADSASNIASYNYEKWYQLHVSQNDGIWVGNHINEQYYLKARKETKEMNETITEEYGFVIEKGVAIKIKLLLDKE